MKITENEMKTLEKIDIVINNLYGEICYDREMDKGDFVKGFNQVMLFLEEYHVNLNNLVIISDIIKYNDIYRKTTNPYEDDDYLHSIMIMYNHTQDYEKVEEFVKFINRLKCIEAEEIRYYASRLAIYLLEYGQGDLSIFREWDDVIKVLGE